MNRRDFIWDIARKHASGIETDNLCRAIKIEMTEENLHDFVKHIFFMFKEEMSLKIEDSQDNFWD